MTGDGVNDAPALRRADAGVAVAGATDAARAAADIVLLAPGLSVIVEAVRLSREIFRRMTNYAIYRITETIRVVVFVTLAILALGFFPVTAAQIVLLALLNDAAILSIAFDRVKASALPERWDMREVLTIASVLGLVGVVESLSLLLVGQHAFGLDEDTLRTLMYLKLSIAGHLTVFVARTRGPFWSVRPANILLVAVLGTQLLATVIAVSGLLMTPAPLAIRGARLGLGPRLVPRPRRRQARHVPPPRPAPRSSPGGGTARPLKPVRHWGSQGERKGSQRNDCRVVPLRGFSLFSRRVRLPSRAPASLSPARLRARP